MAVSFVGILATVPPEVEKAGRKVPPEVPHKNTTPPTTEPEKKATNVDEIAKYSRLITRVFTAPTGEDRQYLRIEMRTLEGWSGASTFNAAAEEMLDILEKLKEKHPGQFGIVNFGLAADLIDQQNNKTSKEVISVTFDMSKVEKLNFDNLLNQRLLNDYATQAGGTKIGDAILADWCKENLDLAAKFCKLVK